MIEYMPPTMNVFIRNISGYMSIIVLMLKNDSGSGIRKPVAASSNTSASPHWPV